MEPGWVLLSCHGPLSRSGLESVRPGGPCPHIPHEKGQESMSCPQAPVPFTGCPGGFVKVLRGQWPAGLPEPTKEARCLEKDTSRGRQRSYQSSVTTFTHDACLVQLVREFAELCNQQHSLVLGCFHAPPSCLLAVAPVPPAQATPDRRSEWIGPFWTLDISPNGITRCGVSRLRLSPSGVLPDPGDTPLPSGRGGTLP